MGRLGRHGLKLRTSLLRNLRRRLATARPLGRKRRNVSPLLPETASEAEEHEVGTALAVGLQRGKLLLCRRRASRMVRHLAEDLPSVVGEAVHVHVLEGAPHGEQEPAQPREFGAPLVRLAQELGADGLLLGRGEVGPHVLGRTPFDEIGEAFSHVPVRDGALLEYSGLSPTCSRRGTLLTLESFTVFSTAG